MIISLVFLMGCASNPGTRAWYKNEINEIERLYQDGEITKKEKKELELKAAGVRAGD